MKPIQRRPRGSRSPRPAVLMVLLLFVLQPSVSHALLGNWAACNHDSDCSSNWCGCNGGATKVCLPNTSYPKSCPAWVNCDHDSECQSSWCGCNGTATKQCLPNTTYPKQCANWVLCDHDNECGSNWCGCNGTATKQCLPNTTYPKQCANWVLCDHDNECGSNWCGCDGGSTKACLPSTAYQKGCTNWALCDHDNECQSNWCGCNGTATKACLPNTSYPKACGGWVLCDHDNECQSNWCGCNGTATKACLPNTSYPKACANWVLCDQDSECGSAWCGCNGGPTRQCLPSTTYPKTCEDLTVWPNSASKANSDDWIMVNHNTIRQMNVRVLAINFANSSPGRPNSTTTLSEMVSAVSSKTCNGTPCSIFAGLDLGSKYHGYSDSSAPAALNYTLAYAVDLSDKGVPPPGWYHNNGSKYPLKCVNGDDHHFNYAALFSPTFTAYYNIRDSQGNLLSLAQLIQSGLVHEVFLYIWGNDSLPDQFNACTSDAQCSVGRVCRDSVGNPCPPSSGCYCRTSDAYQCPSGGPFLPNFGLPEVLEWKPTYDATSHKVRDQNGTPIFSGAASNGAFDQDELPTLQTVGRSIRILNVAATRGPGCAIHSLGHGFEHTRSVVPELNPNFLHFANFDLNGRGFSPNPPFDSWYACTDNCVVFAAPNILNWTYPPTGQTGSMNPYNQGCGSVHFPPNARHAYDDTNSYQVLSSCENFGLHNGTGGQDALQLISNSKWASLSPAQGVVYSNVAPDCEGGWQIYWRQSFPGYHNAATGRTSSGTSDGVPIKNWWPYLFY